MGSPAIFKGSRTKLLTANGIETKDNQFLDYDGELELCRQSLLSFTDGSYSAATRPTGSFTAGAAGLVTSSATPFIGKKFAVTLTKTGACQGAASIQEYDLPTGLRAKVLCLKVDYRVASGTFNAGSSSADSDLIFYIEEFDGTNWKKKEPSTFKLFSNSSTIADQYSGYFQTDADTTKVRVIAFIATTGNNNFSLVCSFSLGVTKYVYGTPITDWVNYTPSWTSSGTQPNIGNGSVTGKWRRVGDSIECQVRVFAGSTTTYGSGTYFLSLPPGLSFDTSKFVDGTEDQRLGYGSIVDSGNNRWFFFVNYEFNSSNKVKFIISSDGTSGFVTSNSVWTPTVPFTFGNGDVMSAFFSGPIQGWSSSVKMSDGYDGREIFVGLSGGQVILPHQTTLKITGMSIHNKSKDTTASWDAANSRYIVPVSGFFRISALGSFAPNNSSGAAANSIILFRNGVFYVEIARRESLAAENQNLNCMVNGQTNPVYLVAGDIIEFYAIQTSGAPRTFGGYFFSIERISSPQTIAMGEVVAARYSTASGQSIPGNTYTTVNFNIKEYDTHNAVTTGTNWVFTAPVAGIYNVSFRLLYNLFSVSPPAEMPTALYKNNNYFCEIGRVIIPTGGSVYPSMGGSADIQLNAGDTISIRANNFTGAARNLIADSIHVWVSIHKIS